MSRENAQRVEKTKPENNAELLELINVTFHRALEYFTNIVESDGRIEKLLEDSLEQDKPNEFFTELFFAAFDIYCEDKKINTKKLKLHLRNVMFDDFKIKSKNFALLDFMVAASQNYKIQENKPKTKIKIEYFINKYYGRGEREVLPTSRSLVPVGNREVSTIENKTKEVAKVPVIKTDIVNIKEKTKIETVLDFNPKAEKLHTYLFGVNFKEIFNDFDFNQYITVLKTKKDSPIEPDLVNIFDKDLQKRNFAYSRLEKAFTMILEKNPELMKSISRFNGKDEVRDVYDKAYAAIIASKMIESLKSELDDQLKRNIYLFEFLKRTSLEPGVKFYSLYIYLTRKLLSKAGKLENSFSKNLDEYIESINFEEMGIDESMSLNVMHNKEEIRLGTIKAAIKSYLGATLNHGVPVMYNFSLDKNKRVVDLRRRDFSEPNELALDTFLSNLETSSGVFSAINNLIFNKDKKAENAKKKLYTHMREFIKNYLICDFRNIFKYDN